LNPKVSSNNNGKTTEVPPSEHNYINPICQYSIAISDTKQQQQLASLRLFRLISDSNFIYWAGEGLAPPNYHWH